MPSLSSHHKTKIGEPTNNEAVAQFLLQQGEYASTIPPTGNTRMPLIFTTAINDGIIATEEQAHTHDRPFMRTLTTAREEDITQWQQEVRDFLEHARRYQQTVDANYQVDLQAWVRTDIWQHISERLLLPQHQTLAGTPTNDQAVHQYLLRQGLYSQTVHTAMTARKSQTLRVQSSRRSTNTQHQHEHSRYKADDNRDADDTTTSSDTAKWDETSASGTLPSITTSSNQEEAQSTETDENGLAREVAENTSDTVSTSVDNTNTSNTTSASLSAVTAQTSEDDGSYSTDVDDIFYV